MKTKRSDFVNKILFIVIAAILSGLLIAFLIGFYKDKKQELNSSTAKIRNTTKSVSNFDYDAYDGYTIMGETLLQLIKEVIQDNDDFSIAVQTLGNAKKATPVTIYYNRALTSSNDINGAGSSLVQNKSSDDYITPAANFLGQVLKNTNDEVTGILFIQKK